MSEPSVPPNAPAETTASPATPDWAERTEQLVLDAALRIVDSIGFNESLVVQAAQDCGLSRGDAELLMPHGARDLAALLSRRHDALALHALSTFDLGSLKVRQRIFAGVEARLEVAAADEGAVRRWATYLAWPTRFPLALRLVWDSADQIWRWAGDTATDENHYSKRAILAGILISALAVRLAQGRTAAEDFVMARIDNVMAFEKWKAGQARPSKLFAEVAAALARLRYR